MLKLLRGSLCKAGKWPAILLFSLSAVITSLGSYAAPSTAGGGSFLGDAMCPDSKYFNGLIDKFCWSCTLPFNLMGFTSSPPDGANTDAFCYCTDELGVPEPGFSVGYWAPEQIIEVTTTPWCSPTLGGAMIQDDLTSMGTTGGGPMADNTTLATFHYNYFANPVFKMLSMFMIPECDKDPGVVDLDLLYMSMMDVTWYNDLLAALFNADAAAFGNPLAQMKCMQDCVQLTATGDASDQNWFCAGCEGNLYPFTGNVSTDNNPIRSSSLIVTRGLASMHRRGLARTTYGEDAMCENVYSPMIPKPMYKVSMAWPIPEVDGSNSQCCHPLGDFWMKWGLGRMAPGGGKDNTFVYNIFRYNDCCVRMF